MAGAAHLAILKQRVAAWNRWRQHDLVVKPDLVKSEPVELTLEHAELKQADPDGMAESTRRTCDR
jgi:hypothetical protein